MEYINPFDFKKIFLEYFLGSVGLFAFAFMIIMSYGCAKFGMSNRLFLILSAIGALIFGVYLGSSIYVIVLFLIGFISFKSLSKAFGN